MESFIKSKSGKVFFYYVLPVIIIANIIILFLEAPWNMLPLIALICTIGLQIQWGRHRFNRCDHCGWDRFLHEEGDRNVYLCKPGWTKEYDMSLWTKYWMTAAIIITAGLGIMFILMRYE